MQEKTVWEKSGRVGKVMISLLLGALLMGGLSALLALFLPSQEDSRYPCRLDSLELVDVPATKDGYRFRGQFQYFDGKTWKAGQSEDMSWLRPKTYQEAKSLISNLKESEKLACEERDGVFKLSIQLDEQVAATENRRVCIGLFFANLTLLGLIHLLVNYKRKTQFRLLFCGVPFCFLFFAIQLSHAMTEHRRTSDWVPVTCQVDFLQYREGLAADLRFHYTYQTQSYEGTQVYGSRGLVGLGLPSPKLAKILQGSKTTTCYVNPNNPEEACLEKRDPTTLLFLLAFIQLGVSLLFLAFRKPRLSWQPQNPRTRIAFTSTALLALGSLVAWFTPGFLGILSQSRMMEQIPYLIVFFLLGGMASGMYLDFRSLGLNRPRIRFGERPTQQRQVYTLYLDFLDNPVATNVYLWDRFDGFKTLMLGATSETGASFELNYDEEVDLPLDLGLTLCVESQGRYWRIPLTGPQTLFDSTSLDNWKPVNRAGNFP